MTKEERTAHANDISNQYVSRISPDKTDVMTEISKLPIQDIITIYSNAWYALKEGMFADVNMDALKAGEPQAQRYADAIEHVKNIVIERLKAAEMLWTVTDKITRSPFIDDVNHVWVFTEKELADSCVDYYMQQYRTTFVVTEIPKDKIIKFFGQTAHMKGAEYFRVDMGGYAGMKLKAEWIVKKPDFSDTPEINRPVMNPVFFRSVAKLQEERYYRADYEGKKEKLRTFEDDMIKAFHDTKFLIPVKGMDKVVDGKTEGKTSIQIPYLSKGEGENKQTFTPVFTDWEEFNKIYSQKEYGGWIWQPQDLLAASDDAVVVNAGSLGFEMSKKMIHQMLDIYEKEFSSKRTLSKDELPADFQPYVKDKMAPDTENIDGTFTVISRMLDAADGVWSNGPVECHDLIEAMATQLCFLVGSPAEIVKTTLKDDDIQKVKANLLSHGRDRIHNSEEESWIYYKPAGKRRTGGPEAAAEALNALNNDKKTDSQTRDPFAEKQAKAKMSPDDVRKYNAIQKKTGGIPLDPYGSEGVCDAINTTIQVLKDKHKDADMEYIQGAVSYTMREDGPYSELTEDERQRVVDIIVDYFSSEKHLGDVDVSVLKSIISSNYDMSDKQAQKNAEKFVRYPDIAKEFMDTAGSKTYGSGVEVAGYTAKTIKEMIGDRLSHIGVYNYLIYLAEEPDNAIRDLKAGLPRK